jgi:hypothetical protein
VQNIGRAFGIRHPATGQSVIKTEQKLIFKGPEVRGHCSFQMSGADCPVTWRKIKKTKGSTKRHRNKTFYIRIKVKVTLVQALRICTGRTAHRGSRGIALPFQDHGTRRGWGVSFTPRPLSTPWKDPVPIVQVAVWASGPVWTGAETRPPPGFDPRTVRTVSSHYTDWASRPTQLMYCSYVLVLCSSLYSDLPWRWGYNRRNMNDGTSLCITFNSSGVYMVVYTNDYGGNARNESC